MKLFDLFEGNEQAYNWHSEPEQRSMDATRAARLYREREPEGSEAIDARLRAQNDQLAQYAQSGNFWLKQKDTQEHISDVFVGKAAANAAAAELLKQRPELRGNLVITAYGPGETQGVAEGRFDEPLTGWHIVYRKSGNPVHATPSFETKDQAQKYLMTKMFANHQDYKVVHTAGVGVAEAPGAETLGHNQSTVSSNLNSLDLDEAQYDRGDYYNARRSSEYGRDLNATGNGGTGAGTKRDDIFKGQSKRLPADPFGRASGAMPNTKTGQVHRIAQPGEVDEGDISQLEKDIADAPVAPIANMEGEEKIGGRYDADDFDDMVARLKKLAGAGPMQTKYDPARRVYRNMPTAQQPPQQPKK